MDASERMTQPGSLAPRVLTARQRVTNQPAVELAACQSGALTGLDIRDVARREDERAWLAMQVGQVLLEREVELPIASNVARASSAGAILVESLAVGSSDRVSQASKAPVKYTHCMALRTTGCLPIPRLRIWNQESNALLIGTAACLLPPTH